MAALFGALPSDLGSSLEASRPTGESGPFLSATSFLERTGRCRGWVHVASDGSERHSPLMFLAADVCLVGEVRHSVEGRRCAEASDTHACGVWRGRKEQWIGFLRKHERRGEDDRVREIER